MVFKVPTTDAQGETFHYSPLSRINALRRVEFARHNTGGQYRPWVSVLYAYLACPELSSVWPSSSLPFGSNLSLPSHWRRHQQQKPHRRPWHPMPTPVRHEWSTVSVSIEENALCPRKCRPCSVKAKPRATLAGSFGMVKVGAHGFGGNSISPRRFFESDSAQKVQASRAVMVLSLTSPCALLLVSPSLVPAPFR